MERETENKLKTEQNIQELWDNTKWPNIYNQKSRMRKQRLKLFEKYFFLKH